MDFAGWWWWSKDKPSTRTPAGVDMPPGTSLPPKIKVVFRTADGKKIKKRKPNAK